MATLKQIEANRRNAQKSTGPKTAAGHETVSRNAITHGLTAARTVVLPDEQEEFDRFSEAMRAEWNPQTLLAFGAREKLAPPRISCTSWGASGRKVS